MINIQIIFIIISIITILITCFQAWTLYQIQKSDHKDINVNDNKKISYENNVNFLRFATNSVVNVPKEKEEFFRYIDNTLYYQLVPDKQNTVLCGSTPEADIFFQNDVFVSKLHFILKHHNNIWFIQDLKSSNGTYLNDICITEPTPLKTGDKITVGNEDISVESAISSSNSYHSKPGELDIEHQKEMQKLLQDLFEQE